VELDTCNNNKIIVNNHKPEVNKTQIHQSPVVPLSILLPQGSFPIGVIVIVVVVLVYFLWFYFHGKAIINAKHHHKSLFTPFTPLLHVVIHPWDGCSSPKPNLVIHCSLEDWPQPQGFRRQVQIKKLQLWLIKLDVPNFNTTIIWTPIFECLFGEIRLRV
jgi:hypothetical protein